MSFKEAIEYAQKYQPAQFGEIPEDWVKAYTVAIPNLPMFPNKETRKFIKWIGKLDGLFGIRPEYPHGTLIMFDTENHAKAARNLIRNYKGGVQVENNICTCYVPPEHAKRRN